MEMKAGTVERFDAATGKGVVRLDEDDGVVPVNFAAGACRGVVPRAGVRVLVGHLGAEPGSGGPLSATFAMRAELVEADRGAGSVELIPTIGITDQRPAPSRAGKSRMRVPFDLAMFPELRSAYREDIVATLTFGRAQPAPIDDRVPAYLHELASAITPVSRRAARYRIAKRKPAVGSTFVCGNVADIGDVPWPRGPKKPLASLLQISLDDARRIGLGHQINVFVDPSELSEPLVLACTPGKRTPSTSALGDAVALELVDEVSVFPDTIGLQSAYIAAGSDLPVDVARFSDVEIAQPRSTEFRSIQEQVRKWFPNSDAVGGADVVLGGFSALHVQSGRPYQRLATFSTERFDWLDDFVQNWEKVAIEVLAGATSMRAFMHGVS